MYSVGELEWLPRAAGWIEADRDSLGLEVEIGKEGARKKSKGFDEG